MATVTILEGPDGSGKSTLASLLKERAVAEGRKVLSFHHGPYPGVAGPELAQIYFRSMHEALLDNQNVLLDRSWLSEPIYAKVHRALPSRILPAHQAMLERTALTANAVVIMCLPPVETCVLNYRARKSQEMVENESKLVDVRSMYWKGSYQLPAMTCLPLVLYDYTQMGALLDLDIKIEIARGPRNLGPGSGAWRPGKVVLIIGEQANVSQAHAERVPVVPFAAFHGSGCSEWLTEQVQETGVKENQLYWINALDPAGRPTDPGFVSKLRPLRVVAMGKVAAAWCQLNKIHHVNIMHPQAHKRFNFKEPYNGLAIQLKEALGA